MRFRFAPTTCLVILGISLLSVARAMPVLNDNTFHSLTGREEMNAGGFNHFGLAPAPLKQPQLALPTISFRSGITGNDEGEPGDHWNVRDVVAEFLVQKRLYDDATPEHFRWENGYRPEGTGFIQFTLKDDEHCHGSCRAVVNKPHSHWTADQPLVGTLGSGGQSWLTVHHTHGNVDT
ncbi:MAG: hypothetical protein NXY57DRAFT_980163 [Lentinula lateritia]|uniref:Uncharacterized protein n=1 Tax=Lentinula lateritia TaxID=40482 RepID=A0ABQ8VWM7_9AGAR|nr:MAG: hypothetical protein NXY57DRAFT_980163 [Lentinula lateritia]KAJ4499634.1 hypothetical protein C8R41DRAFT_31956 [Lentinula lateritia]